MAAASINGVKLKQAIAEFGSLEKAVQNLKDQGDTLNKQKNKLTHENEELALAKKKLLADINGLNSQFNEQKAKLQSLAESLGKWERQYNLFQGFMAMLVGSPSVDSSLRSLVSLLQELAISGWMVTKNADDLRSHFVRTVMGDYLKCFHCKVCGAKFMVNKEPHYKSTSNYYECPSCHTSHGVEPDDSFLRAMVSEEQMANIVLVEKTLKENQAMEPLKVFLNLPCEICGQPMTEWSEQDVRRGVMGSGWGHTQCWNTTKGQARQFAKLVKEELEKRMRNPSK